MNGQGHEDEPELQPIEHPVHPWPESPRTAVIAPTAADALALVREHRLPDGSWFYVTDRASVQGRWTPGWILARIPIGAPLHGDQLAAWDYLVRHGWKPAAT